MDKKCSVLLKHKKITNCGSENQTGSEKIFLTVSSICFLRLPFHFSDLLLNCARNDSVSVAEPTKITIFL
eukprot:UN24405